MSISPQLPPVARTTPHTHTHSQDYDFMSVREGRREQPASPPLSSQPARSSPPALDDAGMHFGRRGAGQQGPTSSTATEPDMNDKWRRCLRGAQHRNVLQSAALRCAQAPYSNISAPFWTYLVLSVIQEIRSLRGRAWLACGFISAALFIPFFEGRWVGFLLSKPKETNFLAWHWLWSL